MFFGKNKTDGNEMGGNLRRRFHRLLLSKRKGSSLPRNIIMRQHPKRPRPLMYSPAMALAKRVVIFSIIVGMVLLGIYLVFFSAFFTITKINLEKTGIAVGGSELAPFLDKLKGKNLLFVDTDSLTRELEQTFKNEILLARTKRIYPNKISVKVEEYPAVFNLHVITPDKTQKLVINQLGYAFLEGDDEKKLPTLTINSQKPFLKNSIVIAKEKLDPIVTAFTKFPELFAMQAREGTWLKRERELHLITERKFEVWLDLTADIETQLKKLKRALPKLDITREPLSYIDLRIAGGENEKVIFKRK